MDFARVEHHGAVATITLNKPERGNALCLQMVEELISCLAQAQSTSRLVVFRGEGRNFCAGLDLSALDGETDATLLLRFVRIETLRNSIETSPVETLCVGQGAAYGAGADLFAACDHRLCLADTRFAFPGVAFGIVLGTSRLASLVGAPAAQSILLARRTVGADQAMSIGLATDHVESQNAAMDRVAELAANAGRLPADAVARLRQVIRQDRSDADLAALTRSASAPGLRDRIQAYSATLKSAAPLSAGGVSVPG
ncbi:enoyl-CoA hydratase/isomerase family protein [Neotabrizicola sp. sgz301269]|uniref:enoyl-CoA hydratase/isomerase family protein n=1 Tax=Neotabrizicola sp. sgz301269 TaxID=3276282 RepID=UPI00377010E0